MLKFTYLANMARSADLQNIYTSITQEITNWCLNESQEQSGTSNSTSSFASKGYGKTGEKPLK